MIACLPEGQIGLSSAAAVAVQMKSTFTSTRFGLMVGIGGISANSRARDMSAYERPCIGYSLAIRVYPIRFCISWDTYKEENTITNWKPQFCPAQKEPLIEDGRLSGIRGFRDGPMFEFFLNVSRMRHPVTTVAQ